MTPSEFDEALNRYGGDLAAWPAAIRTAAARLSEESAAAATALGDMVEVERILRRLRPSAIIGASEIAARASRHRQRPRLARLLPQAGWAAAAAAVLCFGAYVGQIAQQYEHRPSHIMSVALPRLEAFDVD